MEGHFHTEDEADLVFIGQPNVEEERIDNPIVLPGGLSFLLYQDWGLTVKGLDAFPKKDWPDNIPLLYYSYHIMVGLGTMFIGIMGLAFLLLAWRRTLFRFRPFLWVLMLATPFPFIANTAGWLTAELGRQPWLAYELFRTEEGVSPMLTSGNVLFTLIGFMGMYLVMGLLYFLLMIREVAHGPEAEEEEMEVSQVVRST
jgi:cytochrome d ubiquinol oxidase subunit I